MESLDKQKAYLFKNFLKDEEFSRFPDWVVLKLEDPVSSEKVLGKELSLLTPERSEVRESIKTIRGHVKELFGIIDTTVLRIQVLKNIDPVEDSENTSYLFLKDDVVVIRPFDFKKEEGFENPLSHIIIPLVDSTVKYYPNSESDEAETASLTSKDLLIIRDSDISYYSVDSDSKDPVLLTITVMEIDESLEKFYE